MPGFEIFGDEERREVQDVLDTGVLFRYGFDGVRGGHWKARSFEKELARRLGVAHCHLFGEGNLSVASSPSLCTTGVTGSAWGAFGRSAASFFRCLAFGAKSPW